MNIREYDALVKRKMAEDNRARLNFGIVTAMISNCAPFGDPNRTPVHPEDFLPEDARSKALDLTTLEPVEQLNFFLNMFSKRTLRKQ